MTRNSQDGLNAIKAVQSKLDSSSHLEVLSERGRRWKAYFSFSSPASEESLTPVLTKWRLPPTYQQFLLYSNGALLYNDDVYGQWGFQLYGVDELLPKNDLWRGLYSDGWSPSYLVFAESLGDSDLLLLDTERFSNIDEECYVTDGDTGYPVRTWRTIAPSFGVWLGRLVVAQGAKYWRWY